MGACLGPVAAHLHRAALTRTVPRGVVERPPAVVGRADLDPVDPLLDGSLRCCRCQESDSRGCAQLDLAVDRQRHLYDDLPPLSVLLATGKSPQAGDRRGSGPTPGRAFAATGQGSRWPFNALPTRGSPMAGRAAATGSPRPDGGRLRRSSPRRARPGDHCTLADERTRTWPDQRFLVYADPAGHPFCLSR
jgi:hypothetical protein